MAATRDDDTLDPAFLAEEAAYMAVPRSYHIICPNSEGILNFIVMGDQGSGKTSQKEVAVLIAQKQRRCEPAPVAFVLGTGDNIYKYGVGSVTDPLFVSHFDKPYRHVDLPFFLGEGNHDVNFHTEEHRLRTAADYTGLSYIAPELVDHYVPQEKGFERGLHQVARTYLPDDKHPTVAAKKALYQNDRLDLSQLSKWNMPCEAYSLICNQLEIFVINSNDFIADYVKLKQYPSRHLKQPYWNQAQWLIVAYQTAREAGRTPMLVLHQPLVPQGKRSYKPDSYLYVDDALRNNLMFIELFGTENISFEELFIKLFKRENLYFDTIFCGHEHNMVYYKGVMDGYPITQITSGTAGSELHDRSDFTHQPQLGCFLKKHGVVEVQCNTHHPKEETRFLFHTTDGQTIAFSNQDTTPICQPAIGATAEETADTEVFCKVVKRAIDAYLHTFLAPKQEQSQGWFLTKTANLSHGTDGVDRAHALWNYISSHQHDRLNVMIKTVYELLLPSGKRKHSLKTLLNEEMNTQYGCTLKDYYANTLPDEERIALLGCDSPMPRSKSLMAGLCSWGS